MSIEIARSNDSSRPKRHAEIVECGFVPEVGSLPSAPSFVLNDFEVFTSGVMRIEDEELDVAFDVIKHHAQDRVRQHAAADHDGRALGPEVLHQLASFGRQIGAGTDAHEARRDADEVVETVAHLNGFAGEGEER